MVYAQNYMYAWSINETPMAVAFSVFELVICLWWEWMLLCSVLFSNAGTIFFIKHLETRTTQRVRFRLICIWRDYKFESMWSKSYQETMKTRDVRNSSLKMGSKMNSDHSPSPLAASFHLLNWHRNTCTLFPVQSSYQFT